MKLFAVALCLGSLVFFSSQTPIPSRPLGYTYVAPVGGHAPKVVVEIFYDHLCSDSKENWSFMKEVLSDLPGLDVTAIVHIFPLPYHHNAYFAQQVGVVVRQEAQEKFKDYIQLLFDNQDMFLSGAVNMTEPEVQTALAKLTANKLGVDESKIRAGFSDAGIVEKSRYAWKYAASRGITGTPEFIVNGVIASSVEDFTKEQWESFIHKLLNAPY